MLEDIFGIQGSRYLEDENATLINDTFSLPKHNSKSTKDEADDTFLTRTDQQVDQMLNDLHLDEEGTCDEPLCDETLVHCSNTDKLILKKKKKSNNESSVETQKEIRKRPSKKQLAAIHQALRLAREKEESLRKEEEARQKAAEEAERARQEKLRREQEKREKKKLKEKLRRERLKAEGLLLTKAQKRKKARQVATLAFLRQQGIQIPEAGQKSTGPRLGNYRPRKRHDSLLSDEHNSCSSSSSSSKISSSVESKESWDMSSCFPTERLSCSEESEAPEERLRSPVICVLGHVDAGKTKLLDYVRRSHVQEGEAGGITQQIGATMIPRETLGSGGSVPGLLVIDTPGHESFSNLRARGSSICDLAVLVVDITHGLQPQTHEAIELLRQGRTTFVVALNKVDRLYGWQEGKAVAEFQRRCQQITLEFAELGLNAALFDSNPDPRHYVSLVPTSAISGYGVADLLNLLVKMAESPAMGSNRLRFTGQLRATVLEVKAVAGLGTTIDVILVDGTLRIGDSIVLAGQDGPIVTQIRSLLMPEPLRELRVKNPYREYKQVEGAQGIKVAAKDLDKAVAGLPLHVASCPVEIEKLKREMLTLFTEAMGSIKLAERGVYVQASTLGSLEALLAFLRTSGVPFSGIHIGPVVKRDVVKASVMLEHDPHYAVILAFDVRIERDAQDLADSLGVRIFQDNVLYRLTEAFEQYREQMKCRENDKGSGILPCKLRVTTECVFNAKTPHTLSVAVESGILQAGTPLCAPSKGCMYLGKVASIQVDQKQVEVVRAGQQVCLTLQSDCENGLKTYIRRLDCNDLLVSQISRQSIDTLKEYYRDVLTSSEWQLVVELKKLLHIT